MSKFSKDASNTKNKLAGEVKEAVGKATGNEELELKGKLQSSMADLNKKMNNAADKIEDKKDKVAAKINDKIDKSKSKY